MNRSFLEKAKIDIDLTSLLDVIFIILMVVLCHRQVDANNQKAQMEELKEKVAVTQDVEAENLMYEERLDTYENLSEYINLVTVYAEYDLTDVTKRYIRVMNGDEEIKKIEITPDTESQGFEEFTSFMEAIVGENTEKPILCSLDCGQILYRDAVKINEIVSTMKADNLYFKEVAE